jgi:probable addiction module antidote protein
MDTIFTFTKSEKYMRKTTDFDASKYLDSVEMIAEYLNQALASGDCDLLMLAIGDAAKARGIAQIARDTGLGRESLYKVFATGAKPRFDTVLKVLRALGVQMHAYPQAH